MRIILVFYVVPGVQLRLPAEFEAKHFSKDVIDEAARKLARSLNCEYSTWEYA